MPGPVAGAVVDVEAVRRSAPHEGLPEYAQEGDRRGRRVVLRSPRRPRVSASMRGCRAARQSGSRLKVVWLGTVPARDPRVRRRLAGVGAVPREETAGARVVRKARRVA